MTANPRSLNLLDALLAKANASQVDALLRTLEALEGPNLTNVLNHFVETTKVLKVRQTILEKPFLKPREVRAALSLISFHYEKTGDIDIRRDGLDALIGREFTEGDALKHYENNVEGTVLDKGGREITIGDEGMRHLYKESETGDHVVHPDNFQPIRAKRMPWIRWTLQNTLEVYIQEVRKERGAPPWHIFGYVQSFLIPHRDRETGTETRNRNYLFVVVRRKKKDGLLEFVTAYHFDDHETLLKRVGAFDPYYLYPPK